MSSCFFAFFYFPFLFSFWKLWLTIFYKKPTTPTNIDSKSTRNGIFERPPSVATVQALSLMAIFEGISSGENSIESTWALMGLACKLAQSVSLLLSFF